MTKGFSISVCQTYQIILKIDWQQVMSSTGECSFPNEREHRINTKLGYIDISYSDHCW